MSKNNNSDYSLGNIIFCVVMIIICVCLCMYRSIDKASNMREITVTVTDKAVKNDNENSKYLIFTEDENGNIATFEITDSWIVGRFNSSDVYAGIKVGNTYIFTVGGSREEIMSWYPNIYEYELVE